jgi:hypothetical protein
MTYLESLVIHRCKALGDEAAATFFGVQPSHIRQWVNGSKTPSLAAVEKVFREPETPSIEADWLGKDVALCLPWYKQVDPLTAFSLLGLFDWNKFEPIMEFGNAFIVTARNRIADRYVESGLPHSLWIDDDTIPPMGNAEWYRARTGIMSPDEFAGLHVGNRLRSHGKSLVGGLYFGRKPYGRAMYYDAHVDSPEGAEENRRAHEAPFNAIRPTKWVGTGCLWVDRQVFLDIRENNPHLEPLFPGEPFHYFSNASDGVMSRFSEIEAIVTAATAEATAGNAEAASKTLTDACKLIADAKKDVLHHSKNQQGEDQTFGIRAGLAGHQSYVDMGLVCGHAGTIVYGPHNTREPSPRHVHK